ncbi:hypothetical protein ACLOJK_031439 [Asimina triloba]
MPYSNEVGLRMLIGGALREAAILGFQVSPLFSYYSYHGPVFRVMFRVNRGKLPDNKFPVLAMLERLNSYSVSRSLVVSGPLWTGPLHNGDYVTQMLKLAEEWGWAGTGVKGINLEKLLKQMIDESDTDLPFGYIELDEIASRAKVNSPPIQTILNALHKEGYAACRSHIASNAIKTNCPMAVVVVVQLPEIRWLLSNYQMDLKNQ